MRIGIIPDEGFMVSVQSVFHVLEETLARHHQIVRRPLDYFYASAAKQKLLCEEFLRTCDLVVGRIDDTVLQAREQLGDGPPIIGFLMGTMSRGAMEMATRYRYLKSTDILVGNCDGDVNITNKFFTNAQVRKLPFCFDESTFFPIDEQRRQAIRAELRFKPSDKILLYSGRITLEKNLHTLFRIFSVLQDLVPDIHLVVVGDAYPILFQSMGVYPLSSKATLMKLMNELHIRKEQVHFLGSQSSTQLSDLYAMADLLVNFTLHHDENFGFAQVEAQACATPVVGTSWGGLKDTIKHGKTGYQVSTVVTDSGVKLNWWEALNRILALLEDDSRLAQFRENCRGHAMSTFSPASYAETLDSIVDECQTLSSSPSEPLKLTQFARDFWNECQVSEFLPPSFQRGPKAFALYQELIGPFTGFTEAIIAEDEPFRPDQLLVLATAVRIEGILVKFDDPIFPLEVEIPERNQAAANPIFAILEKLPVIDLAALERLLPVSVQSCLQSTLRWMLQKGIVLRSMLMDSYLEPDSSLEKMGQPVFNIQPVDYATDVIVLRQPPRQTYAAT